MQETSPAIKNLNELRQFVHRRLCELNDFEVGAFELVERMLVRCGVFCGIYFCLYGPRSVRLTAIWETDQNTVLFYNATGERRIRTQLATTPTLT